LTRASIRLCFCLAVAVIAAAVADPLVEAASNAGWFGPGSFTDHSSADVLPALTLGCGFVALYVALRVRSTLASSRRKTPTAIRLSNEALGHSALRLLPAIFVLQIVVLFSMETAEQFAVWGHGLGGTIWLGGPVTVSLTVHAVACVVVAVAVARVIRSLASVALRVIRLMRVLGTLLPPKLPPKIGICQTAVVWSWTAFCPRSLGERAPPLPA
jgi:hypothetical protein